MGKKTKPIIRVNINCLHGREKELVFFLCQGGLNLFEEDVFTLTSMHIIQTFGIIGSSPLAIYPDYV